MVSQPATSRAAADPRRTLAWRSIGKQFG